MKCCVTSCNSTNTIYSNSKSITFHKFPVDKVRRDAWFAVLGIEESQLPDSPVVCSLHFKDENFYEGKNGLRVVQRCAVPFVQ
ncbi:jg3442, partial [Pararge aegeria aegeria]